MKEETEMNMAAMTFRFRTSWVHSMTEKRMVVRNPTAQLQNRFHVSAAEIDKQDSHQLIVIGVAAIIPHNVMADSLMNEISWLLMKNVKQRLSMNHGRSDN